MYKKREFSIEGIACKAVLKNSFLTVTIAVPHLTITSTTAFKPLTPTGLKLKEFESGYPEQVASLTIKQCHGFRTMPTTANVGSQA